MALNLLTDIKLQKDATTEGKGFVFLDGDETGTGNPFVVFLMAHDQQKLNKASKAATVVKFKRGRREEDIDDEKFDSIMVPFYVRGWKGFSVKALRKYLVFQAEGHVAESTEVEYSKEHLLHLWKHSLQFRTQVNDIVFNPDLFQDDEELEAGLDENFTSTSKPKAVKDSPRKSSES